MAPQLIDNDAAGAAPTIANGAQGVGAALAAGSHDDAGSVTWGTPAGAAAGVIATVTFGTPKAPPAGLGRAFALWVDIGPNNAATGAAAAMAGTFAVVQYDAQGRATGFTLNAPAAQTASQPAGTFACVYQVLY